MKLILHAESDYVNLWCVNVSQKNLGSFFVSKGKLVELYELLKQISLTCVSYLPIIFVFNSRAGSTLPFIYILHYRGFSFRNSLKI